MGAYFEFKTHLFQESMGSYLVPQGPLTVDEDIYKNITAHKLNTAWNGLREIE